MKVTLITGASSGIGEAFARRLAGEKQNIVLVSRNQKKLHELCDELMLKHSISAHYIAIDLSESDGPQRVFEETSKHGMDVDLLINNAGFGSMGDFAELDCERELEMIRLNISALVELTHLYLKPMRDRRSGAVINVASTASFQPVPYMATYAATKAFVTSFTEAVAEENRSFGISISALCPGPTETNFFAAADAVPFAAKGMQTSEDVVEVGLRGIKKRKAKIISGFRNAVGARLVAFVPNKLITAFVARYLQPKLKEKKLKSAE
jgi:short-subunit dehydrogenase